MVCVSRTACRVLLLFSADLTTVHSKVGMQAYGAYILMFIVMRLSFFVSVCLQQESQVSRIDGATTADKRTKLITAFNKEGSLVGCSHALCHVPICDE